METLYRRVKNNSLSNTGRFLVSTATGLLLPPIIITFIGIEHYGLWALIFAISQLVYLTDFGLQPALSKFVAEFHADASCERINKMVAASMLIYVGGGMLLMGIGAAGWRWILPKIVTADISALADVGLLVAYMVLIHFLGLASGIFAAVLAGLQRMDITNYLNAASILVNAILTWVLLALGLKLWGLALAYAASTIFVLIGAAWWAYKLCPGLSRTFAKHVEFKRGSFEGLLTLSSSDLINRIAGTVSGAFVRSCLGLYAGVSSVGYYDLASRVVNVLGTVPLMFSTPLVPAVSQLVAEGGKNKVGELLAKITHNMNLIGIPLFTFTIVFAFPLVTVWLGPGYELVAVGIQVLAVGTYINMLTAPTYHSLIGLGRPQLGVRFGIIRLSLDLTLTILLTIQIGFAGAVIGQSLALIVPSLDFMLQFNRRYKDLFIGTLSRSLVVPWAIAVLLAMSIWQIYSSVQAQGVWQDILGMFGLAGSFMALYFGLAWKFGLLRLRIGQWSQP